MSSHLPKLIVILGPTASGKSDLAIKLAKKFNGEIVSADSRQVYREMDIGTGKVTKKEMGGIPHYLLDVVSPRKKFTAAKYQKLALEAINKIIKRREFPFLVGGTGLYIQAVVDNIQFPRVSSQKELRKRLEKKSEKELFRIYKNLDPKGAMFIDKENKRRLIRAIEVCRVTGKSFWNQRKKEKPLFDVFEIGIKLPKKELEKRVSKRVKKMIKIGLEKEVKNLVRKYSWKIPALQTIGYQEWKEYFNKKNNLKEVEKRIIQNTKKFTKRQITWFKRDKRIKWIRNYKEAEKLVNNFLK